jgi:hypothetical protein
MACVIVWSFRFDDHSGCANSRTVGSTKEPRTLADAGWSHLKKLPRAPESFVPWRFAFDWGRRNLTATRATRRRSNHARRYKLLHTSQGSADLSLMSRRLEVSVCGKWLKTIAVFGHLFALCKSGGQITGTPCAHIVQFGYLQFW